MAPKPPLQIPLSKAVAVIILLACSATGLLAGDLAHALASSQSDGTTPSGPVISGTLPVYASATASPTPVATDTPAAGSTATNFTLSLDASPRTLSAGEMFTVTVQATTANGSPVSGLSCSLRAPTNGPPGLFATWPASISTDANGTAVWTLTAPSVASGLYGIEVSAVGGHGYQFHRYITVTIS